MRKIHNSIIAILSILAIGLGTAFFATGPAASAATQGAAALQVSTTHICEASGPLCIGGTNLNYGDLFVTKNPPGRDIWQTGSAGSYLFHVASATSNKCLRLNDDTFGNNSDLLAVGHCSGDNGILWTAVPVNGAFKLQNNWWTRALRSPVYLQCTDAVNVICIGNSGPPGNHDFQRFSGVHGP